MSVNPLAVRLPSRYIVYKAEGTNLWNSQLSVGVKGHVYQCKPLENIADLVTFGQGLSPESKHMCSPYHWDDPSRREAEFGQFKQHHDGERDLAYLLFDGDAPVGLFFLWDVGEEITAEGSVLRIPEFGIGIVDDYQGKGLGSFGVDAMIEAAQILGCDAIELTTDLENERAYILYGSRGYRDIGVIQNPVGVDQTAPLGERQQADEFRPEHHMVRLFEKQDEAVLAYLAAKREEQNRAFTG